jgi:hypothetical protein
MSSRLTANAARTWAVRTRSLMSLQGSIAGWWLKLIRHRLLQGMPACSGWC